MKLLLVLNHLRCGSISNKIRLPERGNEGEIIKQRVIIIISIYFTSMETNSKVLIKIDKNEQVKIYDVSMT